MKGLYLERCCINCKNKIRKHIGHTVRLQCKKLIKEVRPHESCEKHSWEHK